MPDYKLQINDAAGNEILNTGTRVGTLLGVQSLPQTNGYIDDNNFALGAPFWAVLVGGTGGVSTPKITVAWTGSVWRLSWTWRVSGASGNPAITLIYGVY